MNKHKIESLGTCFIMLIICSSVPAFHQADPCSDYIYMDMHSGYRSNYWTYKYWVDMICDEYDGPGKPNGTTWHRFKDRAGVQLPERNVPLLNCGTYSPIWMNGNHPTDNQTVQRLVCANYYDGTGCDWNATVNVKKCYEGSSSFYIYQLPRVPGCPIAYCIDGDTYTPCGPGFIWSKENLYCYANGTSPTPLPTPPIPTTPAPTGSTTTALPGTWGPWKQWSSCSKTCNPGLRSRSRDCLSIPCQGSNTEKELCHNDPCDERPGESSNGISVLFAKTITTLMTNRATSSSAEDVMLEVVENEEFMLTMWQSGINDECNANFSSCCGKPVTSQSTETVEFVTRNDIWAASDHPRPYEDVNAEYKFVAVVSESVNIQYCLRTSSSPTTFITAHILKTAVNASAKQVQDETGLTILGYLLPVSSYGGGGGMEDWEIAVIVICSVVGALAIAFVVAAIVLVSR